ncbi:MAG TPA: hypothetical protein VHB68_20910 [Steroidobacteraceae bacterium]|nr:hypothetical protein [Steroidobacteraceae bacterium]
MRRFRWMLAFAALTAGSGGAFADDAHKPVDPVLDDELLEFLGSVDPTSDAVQPDDGSWIEYLSQTDIGKVAKPGDPTVVAAKPATPPSKPGPSGAKQDE